MATISGIQNLLERVSLVTVVKITGCDVFYHEAGEPYVQISVHGLALDGLGNVVPVHIEDSADYGDESRISELVCMYVPGSLYWLEGNVFSLLEGKIYFYGPMIIKPVAGEDVDEFNTLFVTRSPADREPEEQLIRWGRATSCADQDENDGIAVISGILAHLRTVFTKSGEKMAFARLKNNTNHIELVIFPHIHGEYEKALLTGDWITIKGRLDISGDSYYFIPEKFALPGPVNRPH